MLKSTQFSLTAAFAVFLLSGLCFGGVITVDTSATGGNDGSSWSDAYSQLQSALAVASSGDEIRVAQGVYKPAGVSGNRSSTFQLLNGVTIKGGYAGLTEPDPDIRDVDVYETILSGDLNGDDGPDFANNVENSYHVVTGSGTDETAVIDGFTITGGNANVLDFDARGGGMHTLYGSPTINNCIFSRNFALTMGGGMFNYESSPTITDCVFIENRSDDDGGGMRNYLNSHAIITNCDFIDNSAFEDGGGLNNRKNSNAIVTGCMFIGNTSAAGGGMENHDGKIVSTGVPIISSCIFIGNISSTGGGMRNNDVSAVVTNCTFAGNIGSGMNNRKNNPTVTSCIFWANSGGSFDGAGRPTVTFSDVEGGFSGAGNINADPGFVQGGYHLLPGSPCIDAGDFNFVPEPNETDIDGNQRMINGRVDIGAYEYTGVTVPDNDPPAPDPMTWQTLPYATGSVSIAMAATTASDVSGVEYYFVCTSAAGYDSGWQDSAVYLAVGLVPDTQYTFSVQARDKSVNLNTTAWSSNESATTGAPDNDPPAPDPMTWQTLPYATGSVSTAMAATTASDVSGVEYYFVCTSAAGYDSGWQDSAVYLAVGLVPDTQYTFSVQARDKSVNLNTTAWSSNESAVTDVGCIAGTTHVESIVCGTFRGSQGNKYGMASVTIYNNCGEPVSDAEVTGTFTGDYSEQLTSMTDSNGVAVLTTSTQTKKPSYTFSVDNVTHGSLMYNPDDNIETSKSN